jgi:hypothetical protein
MESIITWKAKFQFSDKAREWLVLSICLICMFLFFYTAYSKILDHARFLKGLSNVELIGSFAGYLAWFVPAAEILIAILLIIPQTYKYGLYAFTSLMTLFTGYILSMMLWAAKLPCHCGGAIEKLSWTEHIWFNLAFIALSVFALRLSKNKN